MIEGKQKKVLLALKNGQSKIVLGFNRGSAAKGVARLLAVMVGGGGATPFISPFY